ncbi:hypothetical protein BS50DRAFT_594347 [Corynespora cassiicola Philippines]|uniref:Uncharacterized protein n=1 Tax=Corynespora cassiicola Philippines TaxID=1448308 RepID=A0A2T2N2N0_CORCC|nr:hypothetical protein BS50DRAFT_594347 [Corynespora cassiicola Philippines]
MTLNLVRKRGIPVLAYPASDTASPWPCSLVMKLSEDRMQATLSLQSSVPIHGFDHDQTFIFLYHVDNFVPGSTCLGPVTIPLPQTLLDRVARQGNPQLRTLSISVKEPCPILAPPSSTNMAFKRGFDGPFHQLVKLAKATRIHILFDHNWIHRDQYPRFESLISHPEGFTGFSHGKFISKPHTLVDWAAFGPAEDEPDAPPSYTDASNKRARQISTSPTPKSPPSKRLLLSPVPEFVSSPTEKATTASTPSPRPPLSPVLSKPTFPISQNDRAATASTTNHQPTYPDVATPVSQNALNNAVEILLPNALHQILPGMLHQLFARPPSLPSQSPPSTCNVQSPEPIVSLGSLIKAQVAAHEAHIRKIYADVADHAADVRNAGDVEFHEAIDEYKYEGIAELNRAYDDKLDDLKDDIAEIVGENLQGLREEAAEIVHEVEAHAELVYVDVRQKVDDWVLRERATLRRERAFLRREKDILERNRRDFEEQQRAAGLDPTGRVRRAASLPL